MGPLEERGQLVRSHGGDVWTRWQLTQVGGRGDSSGTQRAKAGVGGELPDEFLRGRREDGSGLGA